MVDIVVVGAGPAGSATASLLVRAGCRVLVLDRSVFPRPKPCGDYVNPGAAAVLDRMGLRDAVIAAGAGPVCGMRVVTPDGTALPLRFPRGGGLAVARRALDYVLVDHAAGGGAAVIEESRVVSVEPDRRGVRVVTEHRGRRAVVPARLVIGADGLRSRVARAIGAGEPPRRGRYTVGAYLEDLAPDPDDPSPGWGELHLGPNGYCGVAYLAGGLANVTIALRREDVAAWRGNEEARYWAALRTFPRLRGRLRRAARAGPFAATGPLGYHRRRPGAGRVLLTGDAAAHVDPMTGQGLFLALRGAELCAAAAVRALERDGRPGIRAYGRARAREFGAMFLGSRLLQTLVFRPGVVRRAARRLTDTPALGARLIGAVANVEPAGAVLRPAFLARVLGLV